MISDEELAQIESDLAEVVKPCAWSQTTIDLLSAYRELKEENAIHHSWPGILSLLDEHYPSDIFTGESGDPGPRIVALVRELERSRNLSVALESELAAKTGEWNYLKAVLPSMHSPAPYLELDEYEGEIAVAAHNGAIDTVLQVMDEIEKAAPSPPKDA